MNKVKRIALLVAGRKVFQPVFELAHKCSLFGMNMGPVDDAELSGEAKVLKIVGEKLSAVRGPVIFDVGANKGQYLKLVIREFGDKAQVYSFEPSKATYEKLVGEIGRSHVNVEMVNVGMGKEAGDVTLFSDVEGSGMASVYKRDLKDAGISFDGSEKVHLTTLDAFAEERGIGRVDFLKLDVEGHELDVLVGGKNLISRGDVRFIQFEFGGCNIDSRTYFRDFFRLLSDKYDIYRVLQDGLRRIPRYDERMEIFTTTNYFAELRK